MTSTTGNTLPLNSTFNFAGWHKQPADHAIPSDMDLQERNQANNNAQTANRLSIRKTWEYEDLVVAGSTIAISRDVGRRLIAYYQYTKDKLEKMVSSPDYCYLLEECEKRVKEAEKKKEDERIAKEAGNNLDGSMELREFSQIDTLTCPPVSIHAYFLTAIKYQMYLSLFWFTDKHMCYVTEHPSEIPVKKNNSMLATTKKALLDCNKLKTTWGSDKTADSYTVLTWIEASGNYLNMLSKLCATADAAKPSYSSHTGAHLETSMWQ
ncbi:hypothetical protein B0H10DRAFT_2232302 [Mycena sp. CBHHK59/15]|nr:hypothetical protein B0H10DRAFT_2232302 [Mycena sp. CBHHK59/15]